jgi:hypothetical protein
MTASSNAAGTFSTQRATSVQTKAMIEVIALPVT